MRREVNEMGEDVDRLASNVTQLHRMFKQMTELIFEQGTIVDRIDYQIEQGATRVKQGTKKIVQAKEHQDNTCANRVIKCQFFVVIAL